jgi:hypothetical protein
MKKKLVPSKYLEMFNYNIPHPMTATLFRANGSWWLEWEDGSRTNLHHRAWGKGRFRKQEMEKIVEGS